MSNSKKITDLAAYTDSQVQSNDLLFITDIAAQETKKITAIDIADYAFNAKSASIFNGNYTGSFTGSFTGSLLGTSSWAINALTAAYASSGGGSGESNTASNIGTSGVGLFKQKSGVDLQFKNISAGSNVFLTDDTVNNALQINLTSTLTSPGGATGNVQFNASGNQFGGNSNLSWDTTNNNKLTVGGNVSSTTFSSSVTNAVGYFGTASFSVSSSNAISSSYALSSSYSLSSSNAITASYISTPNGILSVYSEVVTTATTTNVRLSVAPYYFTGISKTLTPKSTTSKFLITVSAPILVGGGGGAGWASLFKDNTILVDRFVWSDNNITYGGTTTYVDTATDLSTRTYSVKYTTDSGDTIYINFGYAYGVIPSSLSILEINI
jgi:hypothetical protein